MPIVACGIDNDARAAVAAIHAGAKEYIPLPPDPELIAAVLAAVADDTRDLVYRDEAMAQVVKLAAADRGLRRLGADHRRIRHRQGGAGALRAQPLQPRQEAVHLRQLRRDPGDTCWNPNCSATRRAPFTGAVARRIGKFEEATGGTLLLDEISEMDVRLQAKLLRAIQERVIDRVGGTKPVPVDIRIIATSNRNLAEAAREGTFREDLLFRLNVVNLKIPPLRERPADVIELAAVLRQEIRRRQRRAGAPALGRGAARARAQPLARQRARAGKHHPSRRAAADRRRDRRRRHPDAGRRAARPGARTSAAVAHAALAAEQVTRALVGRTVADVERDLILETLKHCLGNRTHAANILGISIRTLRNKLNEYSADGVPVPPPHGGGEVRGAA